MKGLPAVLEEKRGETGMELRIEVPEDCPWFEGHFTALPVLPGVVQIGWAAHYAEKLYGLGPGIRSLEQVKFKRPIQPGMRLELHLKPDLAAGKLRYEYRDAEGPCSSGTLNFGPPGGNPP